MKRAYLVSEFGKLLYYANNFGERIK